MKRFIKMLTVTCVAALALAAVSAAGASAATFTASATGNLVGNATTNQVFTVGGANVVTCKKADTKGVIKSTATTEQEVTVTYTECTATFFGIPVGTVDISPATYNFTAGTPASVHLLNAVSIKATSLGCETIVTSGQTFSGITFTDKSGKVEQHANVTGIKSTSPNGCPSGTSGTYTGSNLTEREGGGTVGFDD